MSACDLIGDPRGVPQAIQIWSLSLKEPSNFSWAAMADDMDIDATSLSRASDMPTAGLVSADLTNFPNFLVSEILVWEFGNTHQTRSNPSLSHSANDILNSTPVGAHSLEQTRRPALQHLSNGQHGSIVPIFSLIA